MILEECDCDCELGDGSEVGERGGVRLCSRCHGIQKLRECATCRVTGVVFVKSWFGLYRRQRCDDCGGSRWEPAWENRPTRIAP